MRQRETERDRERQRETMRDRERQRGTMGRDICCRRHNQVCRGKIIFRVHTFFSPIITFFYNRVSKIRPYNINFGREKGEYFGKSLPHPLPQTLGTLHLAREGGKEMR